MKDDPIPPAQATQATQATQAAQPAQPEPENKRPAYLGYETAAVHAGTQRSAFGENSEALFLTSGFHQPDAQTAALRFAEEQEGFSYARYANPTVQMFEQRLAALEQAEDALATASGMSAILMMCMGLLSAGSHIVCSSSMFGSTIKLIGTELARFGVESSFVSQTKLQEWKLAMRPNTKLLFAETPTNPLTEICDIRALADLAHAHGALLAVDNCFATPILQRPLPMGADLVMHSGTKFLDGQGRVMAGALVGSTALIRGKMLPILKSAGMTLSAFNAWVLLKGLETLPIRMQEQSRKALDLAQWLEQQPMVGRVYYPGLPSHPQFALAQQQQSACGTFYGGAVLSFALDLQDPAQGRQCAFALLDALQCICRTTNLGDTKTLMAHPASTSHGRLSEEQRQTAGVTQALLRLSVGLEDMRDIKADISKGLDRVRKITSGLRQKK